MDASAIVAIVLVLGFVALLVAAGARMKKARPERHPGEAEPEAGPKADGRAETPAKKAEAPAEAGKPKPEGLVIDLPVPKPLSEGLERTRKEGFVGKIHGLLKGGVLDERMLQRVEEALLMSDVGVTTTDFLLEALRKEFRPSNGDQARETLDFLKGKISELLSSVRHGAPDLSQSSSKTVVFLVVGVNGTGKTTTIGKLARYYKLRGAKVLLAAGDTFRAAGSEQLEKWGERLQVPVYAKPQGSDPGAVVYEACQKARKEGFDLLIADTAGRLHTQVDLVAELKKVYRVAGKVLEGAPHEVLLVLDATMGQNAVRQAEVFLQAVNVTGIVLAKLDGTAKGGVVLSIVKDMGIPIRFVGVGERPEDLRPFDPDDFVDALFVE